MVSWNNLDTLSSYKELADVKPACLTEVMSGDNGAERVKNYSVPMAAGLSYNYASKQINENVLAALEKLADEAQLADKFKALYNGEVVKTYYYSTSCGSTTDVTLWGNTTENYPYFVAECVGGVDRGLTLTVESEFNTFIKGENEADYDYDCTLYRWSMEESVKEISEGFARSTGKNVGNIKDIEVLERVNGGAAVKVKVTGDKGETVIDSESAIRAAFGNANVDMNTKSGTTRYANLPSTFCVFEKVTEGKKLTGFKITGGGYGHGIGMSQNAANKMAESMTYAQILEFFYRGTTLTLISSQDNV